MHCFTQQINPRNYNFSLKNPPQIHNSGQILDYITCQNIKRRKGTPPNNLKLKQLSRSERGENINQAKQNQNFYSFLNKNRSFKVKLTF